MDAVIEWLGGLWTWFIEFFTNAVQVIDYWLNKPIPVIGLTIGSVAALVFSIIWFIFKNTSFGKKAIKDLKEGYAKLSNEYETFKRETAEINANIKKFYDDALTTSQAQLNEANKLIGIVAENSHNKKVKDALLSYKDRISLAKTNYDEFLKQKEEEIKAKVEQEYENKYRSELETLKNAIETLTNRLNDLETEDEVEVEEPIIDEELKEVVEDGEREN